jgi:hypothetical protein
MIPEVARMAILRRSADEDNRYAADPRMDGLHSRRTGADDPLTSDVIK